MGDYLSRDQILKDSTVTEDVKYRDGKVLVKELNGDTVQGFFEEGVLEMDGDEVKMHIDKMNFKKIAAVSIVDPETLKPLFTVKEMGTLSFGLIQKAALTAMRLTDFGEEVEEAAEEEEAKKGNKKPVKKD